MALTLAVERKLKKVNLIKLFEDNKPMWLAVSSQSYEYFRKNTPDKSVIRPDDIHGPLVKLMEVNETLDGYLAKRKLTQKYWFAHFTDLVIDRTWGEVVTKADGGADGT